jgi:hypothetical protein
VSGSEVSLMVRVRRRPWEAHGPVPGWAVPPGARDVGVGLLPGDRVTVTLLEGGRAPGRVVAVDEDWVLVEAER